VTQPDPGAVGWKLGIVQLEVRSHREEDNRRRAAAAVAECAAAGCRLVVLPEAFQTGLDLPRSGRLAEPVPGPGSDWLVSLARQHHLHLAAGLLERSGGAVHSSAVLIDGDGVLLGVRRRCFVVSEERPFLTGGEPGEVIETELGKIALLVGYDLHFPEVSRPHFAQQADVLVYCAQLLRPFAHSIRLLALARAAENCCYLALASSAGENTLAKLVYMGGSLILQSAMGVRPYSDELKRQEPVLAEAGEGAQILTADLDLAAQRRLQTVNPLYRDFRASRFFPAAAGAGARESSHPLAAGAREKVGAAQ
jgi:omega-amidase